MLLKDTEFTHLFSEMRQLIYRKGENLMQSQNKAGIAAIVIAAAGATAPIATVQAQGAAIIEEIIITSRRYEESVSDAPVAVNVLNQSFIENNRIDRQDDIFNYTPGATYESFSKLQPTASLRGLTAPTPGNPSSESSIQTVIDNVVVTKDFMKGTPLFDLARTEVLRGPQGTAFGRNASAGLLHFVTNRPDFDDTSGAINATIGSDERRELDGFFNLPLSDTTAVRFSFNHEQEDGQTEGFIFNEATQAIESIGGIDGEENTSLRLQLAFEPSDNFSANFKVEYSEDRDESPIRELCNPGPAVTGGAFGLNATPELSASLVDACDTPFEAFISESNDTVQQNPDTGLGLPDEVDFKLDRDILTVTAEFAWALDNGLNITSVTGFMDGDTDNLSDIVGTASDINWQAVTNDGDSFSTEIRIDNVGTDSSVRWLAGAYLLRDEETRTETLNFAQRDQRGGAFVPTTLFRGGTNETNSWSAFGELTFDVGDRTTLTYGARYLSDEKDYVARASGIGFSGQIAGIPGVGDVCGAIAGPPNPADDICPLLTFDDFPISDSWSASIYKLSLNHELSDTTNVYALYSEGFKSGAFQPDALNAEQASVVTEPEESINYEIGFKGESSSYRYALTFFDVTLDDVQTVNQVAIGDQGLFAGLISNVGRISTTGVEFDGAFALSESLTLSLGFAVQDTEIGGGTPDPSGLLDANTVDLDSGFVGAANGEDLIAEAVSFDGLRPGGAPEWTINVALDYAIQLKGGSTLDLRADFRGRDAVFFQTRDRFEIEQLTLNDGVTMVDVAGDSSDQLLRPTITDFGAQAKWTNADGNISITAWGKNLREDVDVTNFSPFIAAGINDFATGFRGKKELGLTVNYNF